MQTNLKYSNFQNSIVKNDIDYRAIYTSCFPIIKNMILKNGGNLDDAKDIFQESILILHQHSGKDHFNLNVSACTYLYSIARNKWLQQIRNKSNVYHFEDKFEVSDNTHQIDDDEILQKQRLFIKHLANLGGKCQNILQLYFDGLPGEKIAKKLEFSSYEYYRLAKNRCTESLKNMIKKDPVFKELFN